MFLTFSHITKENTKWKADKPEDKNVIFRLKREIVSEEEEENNQIVYKVDLIMKWNELQLGD